MIVENVLNEPRSSLSFGTFKYAFLKDSKKLVLRDNPFAAEKRSDIISLENGNYKIENGVLYIKATRTIWRYLPEYCLDLTLWSGRVIYFPSERFIAAIENPPIIKEIIIKRWWRKNKKIQGVELSESDPTWYKEIQTYDYEIAISDFKVVEAGE